MPARAGEAYTDEKFRWYIVHGGEYELPEIVSAPATWRASRSTHIKYRNFVCIRKFPGKAPGPKLRARSVPRDVLVKRNLRQLEKRISAYDRLARVSFLKL